MSAEDGKEIVLTPEERRLTLAHCLMKVGWTIGFGLSSAARMEHVIALCGNDMVRLSQFNSTAWGLNRMCAAVLGPIVASLSDAYGRLPFLLLGRLGLGCWFAGCAASTKLWHYALTEQLTWGFLMCGWEAVEDAFFADLFGERPELSGRIRSRNGFWSGIAGFVAPFVGIACASRSRLGTILLGAVSQLLQCGVILWHGETLSAPNRKPFKLAMANPFSSLTLLFRNGQGLRRLGYCATCFTGCASSWGTQEPFQFGAPPVGVGMSPAEGSVFDAIFQASGAVSQGLVVQPLLKRLGNRRCFQWTSVSAAVFYVLMSQSWRPLGASHYRRLAQYFVAMALLQSPFNEPSFFCIQPMVMKQGIAACPEAGKGAIAAAYSGLENVMGSIGIFLLGWLARGFIRGEREGWLPWWLAWGGGGHFVLCAMVRFIGGVILWKTPDHQLYLKEESIEAVAESSGGEKRD